MKSRIYVLAILTSMVLITSCGIKMNNIADSDTFTEKDFVVTCLYGHKYLLRSAAGKSYMVPKFDSKTHLPETCETQGAH